MVFWAVDNNMNSRLRSILRLVPTGITVTTCIFCFATPYWLVCQNVETVSFGLWIRCTNDACDWVFKSEEMELGSQKEPASDTCPKIEKEIGSQDWYVVVQGLMSVGFLLSMVAIFVASMCVCSKFKRCNCDIFEAGIMLMVFLSMGTADCLFAIELLSKDLQIGVTEGSGGAILGWSFWLSIGSAMMALLSSIINGYTRRRSTDNNT